MISFGIKIEAMRFFRRIELIPSPRPGDPVGIGVKNIMTFAAEFSNLLPECFIVALTRLCDGCLFGLPLLISSVLRSYYRGIWITQKFN